MRKRIGCLIVALALCLGVTACGGEPTPSPTDEAITTAQADTTTTATQVSTSAEATTTTTPAATTTATETSATATNTPQTIVSPFADLSVTAVALYDPQLFQMEEAVFVKTLAQTDVETVTRQLSTATWEYYRTQDKWVKFYPYFAEWALMLTDTDGKQWVLHLFSDDVGWASLGTFDAGLSYADIIAQAKAHDKEGIDDFGRYQIDKETLAYLLSLF